MSESVQLSLKGFLKKDYMVINESERGSQSRTVPVLAIQCLVLTPTLTEQIKYLSTVGFLLCLSQELVYFWRTKIGVETCKKPERYTPQSHRYAVRTTCMARTFAFTHPMLPYPSSAICCLLCIFVLESTTFHVQHLPSNVVPIRSTTYYLPDIMLQILGFIIAGHIKRRKRKTLKKKKERRSSSLWG